MANKVLVFRSGPIFYSQAGDICLIEIFSIPIFERVGDLSILFGVDWNGE